MSKHSFNTDPDLVKIEIQHKSCPVCNKYTKQTRIRPMADVTLHLCGQKHPVCRMTVDDTPSHIQNAIRNHLALSLIQCNSAISMLSHDMLLWSQDSFKGNWRYILPLAKHLKLTVHQLDDSRYQATLFGLSLRVLFKNTLSPDIKTPDAAKTEACRLALYYLTDAYNAYRKTLQNSAKWRCIS